MRLIIGLICPLISLTVVKDNYFIDGLLILRRGKEEQRFVI